MTDLLDQLGQVTATHAHADHIAQEFADGGERGMAAIFHIRHQRGEPRLEQAGSDLWVPKIGVC